MLEDHKRLPTQWRGNAQPLQARSRASKTFWTAPNSPLTKCRLGRKDTICCAKID